MAIRASLLALFVLLALPPKAATAAAISNLYVFGDSTVDAGNFLSFSGGSTPGAAQGYVNGRWTNGLNYADLLSLALFGAPTTASAMGGNNYGIGGARVVTDPNSLPDMAAQIAAYAAVSGGTADPNALYVLNFGGNDLFALLNLLGDPAGFDAYRTELIQQYSQSLGLLDSMGARQIFFMGFPAIDTLPFTLPLAADVRAALAAVPLDPSTQLYDYDFGAFLTASRSDPVSFGLPADIDVTSFCQANVPPGPGMDCSHYYTFDQIGHMTAAVHEAIYRDINAQFGFAVPPQSDVPEGTSLSLVLIGLGALGGRLRRRAARAGK